MNPVQAIETKNIQTAPNNRARARDNILLHKSYLSDVAAEIVEGTDKSST
jgi:hypothetical protein